MYKFLFLILTLIIFNACDEESGSSVTITEETEEIDMPVGQTQLGGATKSELDIYQNQLNSWYTNRDREARLVAVGAGDLSCHLSDAIVDSRPTDGCGLARFRHALSPLGGDGVTDAP